ncbi:MAG TPA: hypothetical protein VGO50_03480 [Pyrinomonadaceae bacterium]|jgi:hypothetical protein|nr:hypothetical protein [Pyrinomonadaceae bacterium]
MKRSLEEKLLNPRPGSKVAAAKEFGIDLTLLLKNLRLTPQQRIDQLQEVMRVHHQIREQAKHQLKSKKM